MSFRQDEELLQALFDHLITETEFEQLEGRLLDDEEFRSLFHDYARLHHVLSEEFEGQSQVGSPRLRAFRPAQVPRRLFVQSFLSAAAIVVALLVAAYFVTVTVQKPGPVTGVVFGPDTSAAILHEEGGSSLTELREGSTLTVEHGTVALSLPSGVRALVEGPAEVVGQEDNSLRLLSGRAWFDVPSEAVGFTCLTPSLEVVDLGTRFGIHSGDGQPDSVHVLKGEVRVTPVGFAGQAATIGAGEGLVWSGKKLEPATSTPAFLTNHPRRLTVLVDDFSEEDGTLLHGKSPDVGAGPWIVTEGEPVILNGLLDTSGSAKELFAPLGFPRLDDLNHVLLLTIRTDDPDARTFHSEGWAGISLYADGEERLFVGDPGSGGRDQGGWAIHPVGGQTVAPTPPLTGKQTVTLRYSFRTGLAELFEGATASGEARASEWIAPGLQFDQLRVANAEGGDIALRYVNVAILTPQDEPGR